MNNRTAQRPPSLCRATHNNSHGDTHRKSLGMEPRNIKLNRWEWGQEEHQTGQKTRDGKVECIRPEKQEDKLMHRSGKKEAPKEEKIQPLCWTQGPLLESRKETALSSPRNDALSVAIPAC